jgi:hypothetical protein
MFTAYCYRTGEIGVTDGELPEGTLPIGQHPDKSALDEAISTYATHSWQKGLLIVGELRMADTDDDAAEALEQFKGRVENHLST